MAKFENPHGTYDPKSTSGKMAGFSNPLFGEGSLFTKEAWEGDGSGGLPTAAKWATGAIMMDDLNPLVEPTYNTYQPTAYDPNAAGFQLGDAWAQQYGSAAQAMQGRAGPNAQIASGPQDQFRAAQMGLAGALGQRIAGQSPSVAEMQLAQGVGRNIAASKAMAAGSSNPGMAARNAQRAQSEANIAGNMQAAQMRAQEQQAAEQALGGLLGQGRGQDIGLATSQAELSTQTALQQRQMNDQMTRFYEELGYDKDQAQLMANIELEKLKQQEQARVQEMEADIAKQNVQAEKESQGGILGAAGEFVSGIIGMSDERVKENVAPAGEDIDEFMRSLDAVSYDYLGNKGLPKGRQYGIMAQDLEKSKVGKSFVVETPKGKMVDYGRGYGAVLASLRRLEERLGKVEGKAA